MEDALMPLSHDDLSSLPIHLVQRVMHFLDRGSIGALRLCSSSFIAPTNDLISGLRVPLDALHLAQQLSRARRMTTMAHLTHLHIAGAQLEEDDEDAPSVHEQQNLSAADPTSHELEQTTLLMTAVIKFVPYLLRLTLDGMTADSVLVAVEGLLAACPTLTYVALLSVRKREHDEDAWRALWSALARSTSLRRLKLSSFTPLSVRVCSEGMCSLQQLQRLCLSDVHFSDVAEPLRLRLSGLTQLKVSHSRVDLAVVPGLTNLRALHVSHNAQDAPQATEFGILMDGLSHLKQLTRLVLPDLWDWPITSCNQMRGLAFLNLGYVDLLATVLTFLVALTHLSCGDLLLPEWRPATPPLVLPGLRRLLCWNLAPEAPHLLAGRTRFAPLNVTLPALVSLSLRWRNNLPNGGTLTAWWVENLWPDGSEHRMGNLRELSYTVVEQRIHLPMQLAASCPGLEHLTLLRDRTPRLERALASVSLLGRHLRALTLSPSSDGELLSFLQACPRVERLVVCLTTDRACSVFVTVTNAGLATAVACAPLLHDVTVEGFDELTLEGVHALVEVATLQRLCLKACAKKVTWEDVDCILLKSGRAALEVVVINSGSRFV